MFLRNLNTVIITGTVDEERIGRIWDFENLQISAFTYVNRTHSLISFWSLNLSIHPSFIHHPSVQDISLSPLLSFTPLLLLSSHCWRPWLCHPHHRFPRCSLVQSCSHYGSSNCFCVHTRAVCLLAAPFLFSVSFILVNQSSFLSETLFILLHFSDALGSSVRPSLSHLSTV